MKIGIDVDGILRDFCHGLTAVVKKHYPEYIMETEIPDEWCKIKDWHLENNFNCTKEDLQQIYWHDHAKTIMGEGPAFEENVKQMRDMIEWGKDVGITFCNWFSMKPASTLASS